MKNEKSRIRVKWAGPNTPYIRTEADDRRLYLNKRELVNLMHEIKSFIDFYNKDFIEGCIDITDDHEI